MKCERCGGGTFKDRGGVIRHVANNSVMCPGELEGAFSIPEGLCGEGGCVYTPHAGSHSWEAGA